MEKSWKLLESILYSLPARSFHPAEYRGLVEAYGEEDDLPHSTNGILYTLYSPCKDISIIANIAGSKETALSLSDCMQEIYF